jgi:hypothetical protein
MLHRHLNWPALLEEFLAQNKERTFRYGSWDCCLFVADAIQTMTGTDLAAEYREQYSNRAQAMLAVSERTGRPSVRSVAEHQARIHEMLPVEPLRAARGDMVLLKRGKDYSLGIVAMNGYEVLIAMKTGYAAVSIAKACRAWRV